jgi:hypothetical protein
MVKRIKIQVLPKLINSKYFELWKNIRRIICSTRKYSRSFCPQWMVRILTPGAGAVTSASLSGPSWLIGLCVFVVSVWVVPFAVFFADVPRITTSSQRRSPRPRRRRRVALPARGRPGRCATRRTCTSRHTVRAVAGITVVADAAAVAIAEVAAAVVVVAAAAADIFGLFRRWSGLLVAQEYGGHHGDCQEQWWLGHRLV